MVLITSVKDLRRRALIFSRGRSLVFSFHSVRNRTFRKNKIGLRSLGSLYDFGLRPH